MPVAVSDQVSIHGDRSARSASKSPSPEEERDHPDENTVEERVEEIPSRQDSNHPPASWHHEIHHHHDHDHLIQRVDKQGGILDGIFNMISTWWWPGYSQSEEQDPLIVRPEEEGQEASSPSSSSSSSSSTPAMSLTRKYGKFKEVIYYGNTSTIRLHEKKPSSSPSLSSSSSSSSSSSPTRTELYAIKVFHRTSSNLARSEYCIGSCLHHPNIIHTLDLLVDDRGTLYEIMQYHPSSTTLHRLIRTNKKGLPTHDSDCFFKQLLLGISYMHTQGVAHRNIKPDNILITLHGAVKIIDFGNAECFRAPWEERPHLTKRVSGTIPYIAPEEYGGREFDPRAVDVWAVGVTYIAMRTGRLPWWTALEQDDELYVAYLKARREVSGYEPIESFRRECCRNVIYAMLDPNWERRITASQILRSEWVTAIEVCDAGHRGI